MPKVKNDKENFWLARIIVILSFVAVILIGLAISKQVNKNQEIQKDINALKDEAKKIQGDNMRLSEKIVYLEGRDYQEKEIRDKLNLQSPDEQVVVIKPDATEKKTDAVQPQENPQEIIIKVSNSQKWWNYFFKY